MLKKKSKDKKLSLSIGQLICIILMSMILGILIESILIYEKESRILSNTPKELDELIHTYTTIHDQYYKKISKKKLLDAAIEGMVNKLDDPYSVFMNKEDSEEFNETINGEYKGIGVTIKQEDKGFQIISVSKNSPAKKAGIQVGDKIIQINHKSVQNQSIDEISDLIKDCKGKISIKIIRDNQEYTYKVKKTMVDMPTISSKVFIEENKKIGYISISVFSSNTYSHFLSELKKLEKKGIHALIIDVRNNPGGHLDQVSDILDLFLDNKKVLYQISNNKNKKKVYARTKEKREYDISVLINKGSASASEILASAIKESYGGSIIGQNSYGKGSVQKQYKLSSGSSLKYTIKEWLTPNGNCINKVGVEPNEVVEQSKEYYSNPIESNDLQLQKALELLK